MQLLLKMYRMYFIVLQSMLIQTHFNPLCVGTWSTIIKIEKISSRESRRQSLAWSFEIPSTTVCFADISVTI